MPQVRTTSWYRPFDLIEYIIRLLGVRKPESMYSPSKGRMNLMPVSVSKIEA